MSKKKRKKASQKANSYHNQNKTPVVDSATKADDIASATIKVSSESNQKRPKVDFSIDSVYDSITNFISKNKKLGLLILLFTIIATLIPFFNDIHDFIDNFLHPESFQEESADSGNTTEELPSIAEEEISLQENTLVATIDDWENLIFVKEEATRTTYQSGEQKNVIVTYIHDDPKSEFSPCKIKITGRGNLGIGSYRNSNTSVDAPFVIDLEYQSGNYTTDNESGTYEIYLNAIGKSIQGNIVSAELQMAAGAVIKIRDSKFDFSIDNEEIDDEESKPDTSIPNSQPEPYTPPEPNPPASSSPTSNPSPNPSIRLTPNVYLSIILLVICIVILMAIDWQKVAATIVNIMKAVAIVAISILCIVVGASIFSKPSNLGNNETIHADIDSSTAKIDPSSFLSAGYYHTVGLKANGQAIAVGRNDHDQCQVHSWTDIVAVSAGARHSVGLRSDGKVEVAGDNINGQCDVTDWENIIAISAGGYHTVGLKSDGTVIAVGGHKSEQDTSDIDFDQCDVDSWKNIDAISAGGYHTVGRQKDGTMLAVGCRKEPDDGRCNVQDWKDIVDFSAGTYHTVGLKSDGTVIAVGQNDYGECDVGDWEDIIAVSAGTYYTVGLKSDGTVVGVGKNDHHQYPKYPEAAETWRDIVAISAGTYHTVGLKEDGSVVSTGYHKSADFGQYVYDDAEWQDIKHAQ